MPIRSIHLKDHDTKAFDSFNIRSIREVTSGKGLNQDLHRHNFYFLLVVSKGKGLHEIDFVKHEITNSSIFMLRPGQVHQLHLKAGSEGFIVEFDKGFQLLSDDNTLLRKAFTSNVCRLEKKGFDILIYILSSIFEEYKKKQVGFEKVIKASLEIFLIQYLRHQQKRQNDTVKPDLYQQEKLQELLHLLEVGITTKKQVAEYAELMNLSPFQLNSITKGLLGKTVSELIEDQILLEAKRHLLATSNQINQIAFQLGYEDVSYFIRFFKKLTGYTPDVFRKNFR
ncbi:MAG: helix-turn-helix domain-containing protein [Bacteroidetes bacterium]|nr:helix-turn-helix domain-containing protein [Bacteroidota bacterium]